MSGPETAVDLVRIKFMPPASRHEACKCLATVSNHEAYINIKGNYLKLVYTLVQPVQFLLA